ncbi:hypothetical protein ZWY2020_019922 [Hordeum vulgare]|nr:hypothetical protein ZWY2020_019922 [Hordeum vulgare]
MAKHLPEPPPQPPPSCVGSGEDRHGSRRLEALSGVAIAMGSQRTPSILRRPAHSRESDPVAAPRCLGGPELLGSVLPAHLRPAGCLHPSRPKRFFLG